jgi:hypothetical protein
MKGIVRVVMVVGLMCVSATVFAGNVLTVGPDGKYKTIALAMAAASTGDTISVAPKTYTENITLKSGVTLVGEETARTFLQAASNATPVITATGVTECRISRFTFINSTTGIELSNSSAVTIAANVFNLGTGGTAVNAKDAADASSITNNTFYTNKLAISRAGISTTIQNNIFASNTTAISSADITTKIDHNLFSPVTAAGQMGSDSPILTANDPLFVEPKISVRDFHLKLTSAAINGGTGTDLIDASSADVGAYGGQYADPKPYPVQDVRWSGSNPAVISPAFELTLSWAPNESYLIDSYNVQFSLTGTSESSIKFGATSTSTSPYKVGKVSSIVLSGSASSTADALAKPVLNPIQPKSHALTLTWSPVATATSYEVHYGITEDRLSAVEAQPEVVGDVTTYVLSGLENKKTYMVWVVAVKQPILHVAVNVQDNFTHQSDYSAELTEAVGDAIKSDVSIAGFGIPEEIVAYPALPNEGCFIATAAYGSYSAAQVKTLRDFRDHYLLTNAPGRAFVSWYYANSPPAAQYLNQHPALKPMVRGLLLPFVLITSWINSATLEMQVTAVVLVLSLLGLGIYWRRRTSWA